MMKVGIVGMPNAGKSSLFNALTRAGARGGQLPVHDDRAERGGRAGARRAARRGREDRRLVEHRARHDRVPRHRRAGRGRAQGRGPGQPVPGQHPRDRRDAARRPRPRRRQRRPPRGRASTPPRDIETIETELVYADLEQAERRHARVVREARGGDKAAIAEEAWLRAGDRGAAGRAARRARCRCPTPRRTRSRNLSPLTGKPVLFVANVDEGDDDGPAVIADARRRARRRARWRSRRASRPSCPSSTTRRPTSCARSWASASPACSASSTARSGCST